MTTREAALAAALKGVLGIARAATVHSGGEHNRKRIAAAEAALALPSDEGWRDMKSSPKDGTQVQLLWPYPRGHSVGWQWSNEGIYVNGPHDGGYWFRRRPTWGGMTDAPSIGKLLPEEEWSVETRPGSKPLGWMPLPPPPKGEAS